MKIWLLQTGEQLPIGQGARKLRTELLAEKLIERGHTVTWWTSCFDHLRKRWYFDQDTIFTASPSLTIHALKGMAYRRNFSLARFLDHRIIARKNQEGIMRHNYLSPFCYVGVHGAEKDQPMFRH